MAARKKKVAKKKTTKTSTRRRAPNPLSASLDVRKVMRVETGAVYLVKLKGEGKATCELGHVTASSETDAKKKARNYLRRLL